MIILALDLGKFNTMCCLYYSKTQKHDFINAPPSETTLPRENGGVAAKVAHLCLLP